MKPSRLRTLLLGLVAGVAYAFLTMLLVRSTHRSVSITYIFCLPLVMGAIPVLFSTKEQLRSYTHILIAPVLGVLTFFYLSFLAGFEGLICLVVIVGPFIVLGAIGAFVFRLISLKNKEHQTPLYCSLLVPFLFLILESNFQASDQFYTVRTAIDITADRETIWMQSKSVRNIKPSEISPHFVHMIGVPKPLDGVLDKDSVGGIRSITWERGIKFREIIHTWQEGLGFAYDIKVDPTSIPPTTLDEHVMIGGEYFDVVAGSYEIDSVSPGRHKLSLSCKYRVTTNLNFYSRWWADFILNDFNEMILEVIKRRCEARPAS